MKKLTLDLTGVDPEGGDTWADCPARAAVENALLDYAGKVVTVVICERRKTQRAEPRSQLHKGTQEERNGIDRELT